MVKAPHDAIAPASLRPALWLGQKKKSAPDARETTPSTLISRVAGPAVVRRFRTAASDGNNILVRGFLAISDSSNAPMD
jgi:hypothetical protein